MSQFNIDKYWFIWLRELVLLRAVFAITIQSKLKIYNFLQISQVVTQLVGSFSGLNNWYMSEELKSRPRLPPLLRLQHTLPCRKDFLVQLYSFDLQSQIKTEM
jgi:hypothetical protein